MYKPRVQSMVWKAIWAPLVCALFALPAAADSQARIVRLSDVHGAVQIDKNAGLGFETAFANLPITQGSQLRTQGSGRAEIEFEDGSTLRVIPNTLVRFDQLTLSESGKRLSRVELAHGRAYVNWVGKSGDEFTLSFSDEKVELSQAAHFRVANSQGSAEVASFKNDLVVEAPSGTVKVAKSKMVTFDADDNGKSTVAKNVEADPYDQWDNQANDYHSQYSKNDTTPYGYGFADLNYYGGYSNLPGYGTLWQPFFAGVGWNPFMDGAWSFYPGMGYMWASAYPWGWMPYYYGNWMFVPGFGWGWQPGNWNTWKGGIHYVGAVGAMFQPPVAPRGTVSTVVVGKGGPVARQSTLPRTVVSSGSAGLGILRGSYENLRHLNSQVAKSGSVELHAAPQFAASSPAPGYGAMQPMSATGASGHAGTASSGHAAGAGGHIAH